MGLWHERVLIAVVANGHALRRRRPPGRAHAQRLEHVSSHVVAEGLPSHALDDEPQERIAQVGVGDALARLASQGNAFVEESRQLAPVVAVGDRAPGVVVSQTRCHGEQVANRDRRGARRETAHSSQFDDIARCRLI
jgi:hypothetical protein